MRRPAAARARVGRQLAERDVVAGVVQPAVLVEEPRAGDADAGRRQRRAQRPRKPGCGAATSVSSSSRLPRARRTARLMAAASGAAGTAAAAAPPSASKTASKRGGAPQLCSPDVTNARRGRGSSCSSRSSKREWLGSAYVGCADASTGESSTSLANGGSSSSAASARSSAPSRCSA